MSQSSKRILDLRRNCVTHLFLEHGWFPSSWWTYIQTIVVVVVIIDNHWRCCFLFKPKWRQHSRPLTATSFRHAVNSSWRSERSDRKWCPPSTTIATTTTIRLRRQQQQHRRRHLHRQCWPPFHSMNPVRLQLRALPTFIPNLSPHRRRHLLLTQRHLHLQPIPIPECCKNLMRSRHYHRPSPIISF